MRCSKNKILCRKKVKKLLKKVLTNEKRRDIMVKLTREGQQNNKKNLDN